MRASVILLALLFLSPGSVDAAPQCPDGRFLVHGPPLAGEGPWDAQTVVLDGRQLTLGSVCGPARARRGRRLRATVRDCGAAGHTLRLAARFRQGCTRIEGRMIVRGGARQRQRRFTATRIVPGEVAVIPRPAAVEVPSGRGFPVTDATAIAIPSGAAGARAAADVLHALLAPHLSGLPAVVETATDPPPPGTIRITDDGADAALGDEGYQLVITADAVTLRAPAAAGLFYGIQTLRQLLPAAIEEPSADAPGWELPPARVVDGPRFVWRGLMLDVSRAFFPVAFVRRAVDLLALHKMNVLHLHLTDDQGWRFESLRHPSLHEVGSMWDAAFPDERGGYFTQAELRELVAYADARHVTVVPEIDMPGHSLAALRALPDLACTTSPGMVRTRDEFRISPWHLGPLIHAEILCAGRERVYQVMQEVLGEVLDVFPSHFIHLGGDEVPKAEWETSWECEQTVAAEGLTGMEHLQAWFTKRMETFLRGRGRRLIAWDEVLDAQAAGDARTALAADTAVMRWRDLRPVPPGLAAQDVVHTPFTRLYLDYRGANALDRAYTFDPAPPTLAPEQAARVLGAQGNMWTGFPEARFEAGVDVHVFPRLLAIAELTWTPQARRELADFEARRAVHSDRLDLLGVARD